jgi:DNA invertase Pin-like site-specific DNA recombinase
VLSLLPSANRFVVHILAAVAGQEALAISNRTKAALEAAKARCTQMGEPARISRAWLR